MPAYWVLGSDDQAGASEITEGTEIDVCDAGVFVWPTVLFEARSFFIFLGALCVLCGKSVRRMGVADDRVRQVLAASTAACTDLPDLAEFGDDLRECRVAG